MKITIPIDVMIECRFDNFAIYEDYGTLRFNNKNTHISVCILGLKKHNFIEEKSYYCNIKSFTLTEIEYMKYYFKTFDSLDEAKDFIPYVDDF